MHMLEHDNYIDSYVSTCWLYWPTCLSKKFVLTHKIHYARCNELHVWKCWFYLCIFLNKIGVFVQMLECSIFLLMLMFELVVHTDILVLTSGLHWCRYPCLNIQVVLIHLLEHSGCIISYWSSCFNVLVEFMRMFELAGSMAECSFTN